MDILNRDCRLVADGDDWTNTYLVTNVRHADTYPFELEVELDNDPDLTFYFFEIVLLGASHGHAR